MKPIRWEIWHEPWAQFSNQITDSVLHEVRTFLWQKIRSNSVDVIEARIRWEVWDRP